MSRYATLLEPSTAPPTPRPDVAPKYAPKAPVVPPISPSKTQTDMTAAPAAISRNPPLRDATKIIEPELKPMPGSEMLTQEAAVEVGDEPQMIRTNERKFERSTERSIKRTVKRSIDQTNERTKVRHTFDILDDQLLTLREISIERQKLFGRRVLLGELVQEALDLFISNERNNV